MPTKDEIIDIVLNSDSEYDWESNNIPWIKLNKEGNIYLSGKGIKYYKNDVHLRFERLDGSCDDFVAEWTNNFADPKAFSYIYMLYYGSTPIMEFILVSVDGVGAYLPIPKQNLEVERLEFKVAEIHDSLNILIDYMNRAGLTVKDD